MGRSEEPMSVTITLPRNLEAELKSAADARKSSIEELVIALLDKAIQAYLAPSPEEIVTEIRAVRPATVRAANGSLAEALSSAPEDPDFDLEAWRRGWSAVEAEMKVLTRANDLAEGRG